MYRMKKIVTYDEEISLPKCMYSLNPIFSIDDSNENEDINIDKQVTKFLQAPSIEMAELEKRQDQLLKKLDLLYDRIKSLSSSCQVHDVQKPKSNSLSIAAPDEIVLTASAQNLPWSIAILEKMSTPFNTKWHIHSTVSDVNHDKVLGFVGLLSGSKKSSSTVNVRVLFVNESSELKLSSLTIPILGTVNILRYLSLIFPKNVPYDGDDFAVDALLDICHKLENTKNEKNKEALIRTLFANYEDWIYNKSLSIVDLAAFHVIKQLYVSKGCPKLIPKEWYDKFNKFCK